MRWTARTPKHRKNWHKWYAWHPIKVEHQYIWFEYVYRKWGHLPGEYGASWHYRIELSESNIN